MEFDQYELKGYKPLDSLGTYLKFINKTKLPANPELLPDNVFLPIEALGDIWEAIITTRSQNVEYLQLISWDKRQQRFVYSKLFKGSYDRISSESAAATIKTWFSRGFLAYHTHPGNDWRFSIEDISREKALPRLCYIDMVVTATGIGALLKTSQSLRMPFYGPQTISNVQKRLRRAEYYKRDFQGMCRLIEAEGFGYYIHNPNGPTFEVSDFVEGIKLYRVRTFD